MCLKVASDNRIKLFSGSKLKDLLPGVALKSKVHNMFYTILLWKLFIFTLQNEPKFAKGCVSGNASNVSFSIKCPMCSHC